MENNKQHKFGLLGKDIDYSFSRTYFAEKFQREKRTNCQYDNYDCPSVDEVHNIILRNDLSGLNVTIPYKEVVALMLDELSPQAEEIGAVNTIVYTKSGKRVGHNTDAYGFEKIPLRSMEWHSKNSAYFRNRRGIQSRRIRPKTKRHSTPVCLA